MPLLLDLFCGAGGAAAGYAATGFDVVGVDHDEQTAYPFRFYRGDVFELLPKLLAMLKPDAIHASPPCQHWVTLSAKREFHPDLIEPTRDVLAPLQIPWIIENVKGAPLRNPTLLCGSTFGLGVFEYGLWYQLQRHRYFESNMPLAGNGPCKHTYPSVGVYGKPGGSDRRRTIKNASLAGWKIAMGIDWMSGSMLTQAIPPAYTVHLGDQLLKML